MHNLFMIGIYLGNRFIVKKKKLRANELEDEYEYKSDLDTILNTCKNIDIPPVPNKKAVNIIFKEIAFICIFEINAIPFVISNNPVIIGAIKVVGILKNLKHGDIISVNKSKKLLALNIDIITEKITINPPIIVIVEIALYIELDNIIPKSENFMFLDSL